MSNLPSTSIHAANRKPRNWMVWLTAVSLFLIISLGCGKPEQIRTLPTGHANYPGGPTIQPRVFLETDCNISGITFPDITVDYVVNDTFDGHYLICNLSSVGSDNLSVHYYIQVAAYKADKLDTIYQEIQKNIQGFVDQSTERNAAAIDFPEAQDEITFIRNDSDGYLFMITSWANVQNCEIGSGYGVEKVKGKYLVQVQFQSCELADAAAYTAVLKNLETAALAAIQRVEGAGNP